MPRLVSLLLLVAYAVPAHAADGPGLPWWFWALALFVVSFAIGVVAVIAGVGGGVLFVPLVSSFFPFHLDFVRGAGLLVALSAALSAAPTLLRTGIASLRLAMPLALIGSVTSIVGALLGFVVPVRALELALGVLILIIVLLMAATKSADHPQVAKMDALAAVLGLRGLYEDRGLKREIEWMTHRTPAGLAAFAVIGLVGGLFGLGAGWANVPALNLLMGAPIKLAVGTSGLAISIINTSAAWIFLNRGAVLPIIVVPSIIGVILGARIGAKLLTVTPGAVIRRLVIVMLALAGTRALLKGLGLWG